MIAESFSQLVSAEPNGVVRADVLSVNADGSVLVCVSEGEYREIVCDRLQTGAELTPLARMDSVLCFVPNSSADRGVVLGKVGSNRTDTPPPTAAPESAAPSAGQEPVDTLVLEAKQRLVLRVGDGSIEIRADGKILIKGTDLVSHAKRMNRIKGGAVSIN